MTGEPRRVLIDARAAARTELGGVERWAREMAARLPALRPGAYAVARPPGVLAHRAGQLWEQTVMPLRAAAARASLVYAPANLAPLAWPRNVVVVHDAAALRHPEWYSRSYAAWQRRTLPAIVRRATHVVTVSEFSLGELEELAGLDRRHASVIPGGVDERFRPGADPELARRALGLERPYVLTVASRIARKNLRALEPAVASLKAQGIELVAAGGGRPHLRAEAEASGLRALGAVPDELLPGLYAGASAFVLPSLYEGFGLTCLEAMASGVPVAASNRGALPEVCDGAALLFDPADPAAVGEAVTRAAFDEDERRRLVTAGLERAKPLTWHAAATATDALLAAVAERA
jgi:glycosyltransferase involved in cell wall biosynthesis